MNYYSVSVRKYSSPTVKTLQSFTECKTYEECVREFKIRTKKYIDDMVFGYNEPIFITASEGSKVIATFQIR